MDYNLLLALFILILKLYLIWPLETPKVVICALLMCPTLSENQPEISHFLRSSGFFEGRIVFRSQDLNVRYFHSYEGVAAARASQN